MSRPQAPLPQPPASYTPQAVEAWLAVGARGAKVHRMDAFRNPQRRLENLELHLGIDALATQVRPTPAFLEWLRDLTGGAAFEPHFEIPAVVEFVARTLARGRFSSVVRIESDGETLFANPDRGKDLRNTVHLVTESSHRATRCDAVTLHAVDDEFGDTQAVVTIRKQPKKGEHALHFRFEGEVPEADFQAMLAHLRQGLNSVFHVDGAAA